MLNGNGSDNEIFQLAIDLACRARASCLNSSNIDQAEVQRARHEVNRFVALRRRQIVSLTASESRDALLAFQYAEELAFSMAKSARDPEPRLEALENVKKLRQFRHRYWGRGLTEPVRA